MMQLVTPSFSFIWVIGVLLAGCSTLDDKMGRYLGESRDKLVKDWGPPSEEELLKKGGRRLVYLEQRPLAYASKHVDTSLRICEKAFVTDSRGTIKSYSHNNCE